MISPVNNTVFQTFKLVVPSSPSNKSEAAAASSAKSSSASNEDRVTLSAAAQQSVQPSADVDRDGDSR